jgi:hypothetical protein
MSESQNTGEDSRVFEIKDCALIAIATGSRAINLKELRDILSTISLDSVYYHFWGGLLQPRFEEREYNNDFAAVVDPTEFKDLEDLRQELLEIIEERLDEQIYHSLLYASSSFEFIRSQIVVFDTQKRMKTPEELAELLPTLSTGSIFYHFIDARRRLEHHGDDLSFWLSGCEPRYHVLCSKLAGIDPYFGNLIQLKQQLTKIFQDFFVKEGI